MAFFSRLGGAFTSAFEAAVEVFASQSPLVDSIITTGASAVGAITGASPATVDQVVAGINEARRIISPVAQNILAFKAASNSSGNDEAKVRAGASLGIPNNAYVLAATNAPSNIAQVRAAAPVTATERAPDAGSRTTIQFADSVAKKVDDMLYAMEQVKPNRLIAPSGYMSNANLEPWVRVGTINSEGGNYSLGGAFGTTAPAAIAQNQFYAFPRPQYLKTSLYQQQLQVRPLSYLAGAPATQSQLAWTATNMSLRFLLANGSTQDVQVITAVNAFIANVPIPATAVAVIGFIVASATLVFGIALNEYGVPLVTIAPISQVTYIDYLGVTQFLRDGSTWFDVYGNLSADQSYIDPNFSVVKIFEQRFTDDADIVNVLQAVDKFLGSSIGTSLSATAQINCGGNAISFTDIVPLSWMYSSSVVFDSMTNAVSLWQQVKNALEVARDGCALSDQLSLNLQANLQGVL